MNLNYVVITRNNKLAQGNVLWGNIFQNKIHVHVTVTIYSRQR